MTKRWVFVPAVKGWVREHDPRTESGLVPQSEPDSTEPKTD